jgi:long-subunit fatty acid transport protein
MKTRNVQLWTVMVTLTAMLALPAVAQYPEDALRFATPGLGVGARSLGMGNAYTGVANDFSALYWNPAGLAQMEFGEFSFGLSQFNHKNAGTLFDGNTGTRFGSPLSYSNTATNLNSLGLTFPVEVRRGALVFGFGFQRQANFTTGLSFEGFNPVSSIIQSYAPDSAYYPTDFTLPEHLQLAEGDTNTGRFHSPIKNRVTQAGQVLEGGGINHWSFGGAMDVAENVSVGATLTYASGTYKYDRSYTETDTRNIYQTFPYDFDRLTIEEFVESDISGFGAKLGLMYRVPDRFRFGIAVKTPTTYQVKEDFGTTARSYFDNGYISPSSGPYETTGSGEYDVVTPWVFSAGASFVLQDILLSGDIEYTDWTQLEFASAPSSLMALNKDIKTLFRPTATLRAGAEYNISQIGLRLRGGFIYNPSPFEGDPSSFDQKSVTGGVGFLLGQSTMLDVGYAHGWWKSFRSNYNGPSQVSESVKTNTFLATFSYRF